MKDSIEDRIRNNRRNKSVVNVAACTIPTTLIAMFTNLALVYKSGTLHEHNFNNVVGPCLCMLSFGSGLCAISAGAPYKKNKISIGCSALSYGMALSSVFLSASELIKSESYDVPKNDHRAQVYMCDTKPQNDLVNVPEYELLTL